MLFTPYLTPADISSRQKIQNGEFWMQVEEEVGFVSKWYIGGSQVVLADNWEKSVRAGRKFRLYLSNNEEQHGVLHDTWDGFVKPHLTEIKRNCGWEDC